MKTLTMKTDHKDDKGKLMWHLLPLSLMKPVVEIFQYGLQKYNEEGSWAKLDNGYIRYRDAFFRHLEAHESGQLNDTESGYPHIQHCAWNALAMMFYSLKDNKNGTSEESITD